MASNDKNFIVKNGITSGSGTQDKYSFQSTDGQINQVLITDGNGNATWQAMTFEYVEGDFDGGTY